MDRLSAQGCAISLLARTCKLAHRVEPHVHRVAHSDCIGLRVILGKLCRGRTFFVAGFLLPGATSSHSSTPQHEDVLAPGLLQSERLAQVRCCLSASTRDEGDATSEREHFCLDSVCDFV